MESYYPEGYLLNTTENRAILSSTKGLEDASLKRKIVEATVTLCDYEHNLLVDLGEIKGIIPREEGAIGIREGTVRDIALISRVGKPVSFIIESVDADNKTAVLSRRAAQEKCQAEYISSLIPGDIINAKVTHLENFGAFCDIGCGIIALMPIDAISVSRISHPSDRFSSGDSIKAAVKSIDELGRVSLSQRELLGTWEENAAEFLQGETVEGIVRTVEDYGIFIELAPNLAGLAEPRDDVEAGQKVSVYIKSIIKEKMKLKLIIIDVFDAEKRSSPIKYFIDDGHIDRWQYSPDGCSKIIATEF